MKKLAIVLMMLCAVSLLAQEPAKEKKDDDSMKDCPMHAKHQKDTAVDQRGDIGMGFSHEKTGHHFLLSADGGSIEAFADSADDTDSIGEIRMHMRHIAMMFTNGDYSIPMFVHDQTPPGVPVMQSLKKDISYKYEETRLGARVRIKTQNAEALKAIQQFLKFQITEHRTGDNSTIH
jgi:hypothetical protein